MTIPSVQSSSPPQTSGWAVSARRNTAATLTIQTAEGDTVKLSFAARSATDALSVSGGDSSLSGASASDSVSVSLTTEGDLNKDEIRDIKRLIHKFAAAVRDTSNGNTDKAAQRFLRGGKYGSLSGFSVNVTSDRAVEAASVDYLA
jgi:hypothetical protein